VLHVLKDGSNGHRGYDARFSAADPCQVQVKHPDAKHLGLGQ
jgi:hypothetical protein